MRAEPILKTLLGAPILAWPSQTTRIRTQVQLCTRRASSRPGSWRAAILCEPQLPEGVGPVKELAYSEHAMNRISEG